MTLTRTTIMKMTLMTLMISPSWSGFTALVPVVCQHKCSKYKTIKCALVPVLCQQTGILFSVTTWPLTLVNNIWSTISAISDIVDHLSTHPCNLKNTCSEYCWGKKPPVHSPLQSAINDDPPLVDEIRAFSIHPPSNNLSSRACRMLPHKWFPWCVFLVCAKTFDILNTFACK